MCPGAIECPLADIPGVAITQIYGDGDLRDGNPFIKKSEFALSTLCDTMLSHNY